jgi:membrane protein YqaA with SNARE-associated domain
VKILESLSRYLTLLGAPGAFALAFLDSSAIPMVGGPDALVMLLCWQSPQSGWITAVCAAAGSAFGCLALYMIGRGGGELALARFDRTRREWARQKLDQNAFWSVFAAVIAPPPFPTKLVIVAAGAFGVRLTSFTAGVFAGRLLRYGLEGYLGARFGDRAAALLRAQYPLLSLAVIACVAALVLLRRHRRKAQAPVAASAGISKQDLS